MVIFLNSSIIYFDNGNVNGTMSHWSKVDPVYINVNWN